jgi:hypothetical protein
MDKIEPSGFSSTRLLTELIRDTEEMYAIHFGEYEASHPLSKTDGRSESQLGVTRRERCVIFVLDGNIRLITLSPSDPVYIWV